MALFGAGPATGVWLCSARVLSSADSENRYCDRAFVSTGLLPVRRWCGGEADLASFGRMAWAAPLDPGHFPLIAVVLRAKRNRGSVRSANGGDRRGAVALFGRVVGSMALGSVGRIVPRGGWVCLAHRVQGRSERRRSLVNRVVKERRYYRVLGVEVPVIPIVEGDSIGCLVFMCADGLMRLTP